MTGVQTCALPICGKPFCKLKNNIVPKGETSGILGNIDKPIIISCDSPVFDFGMEENINGEMVTGNFILSSIEIYQIINVRITADLINKCTFKNLQIDKLNRLSVCR